MGYSIRILPSAYKDLRQARDWYRQHNAELPKRFTHQVRSSLDHVKIAPFAHTIRYKDVRIANMSIFPYAIHYIIRGYVIVVIAIHHIAISPEKWETRL